MAGIISYGVAIPRRRLRYSDVHSVWKNVSQDMLEKFGLTERCVTGPDEDAITLGVESAKQCLNRAGVDLCQVDALIFCSGTNPYATKAAASTVQDILGLRNGIIATDVQFAGRSGADGLVLASALVDSGMAGSALVLASDCLNLHVPPGHAYEYAASAGSASFLVGRERTVADLICFTAYSSDRPDWFRVSGERYMQLGGGFVGYVSNWGLLENLEPAWKHLMEKAGMTPDDLQYAVVPGAAGMAPLMICNRLNLSLDIVLPWVLTASIGDTGCAAVPLSLCHVLDNAGPGEKVAVLAYGWGGGAIVMLFETTGHLESLPGRPVVVPQIAKAEYVDYARALKYEYKIARPAKGFSSYY